MGSCRTERETTRQRVIPIVARQLHIERFVRAGIVIVEAALVVLGIHALKAADPDKVSFNRDIRPIMSDTCFRCHGPDKSSRMAGMRSGHPRRSAQAHAFRTYSHRARRSG